MTEEYLTAQISEMLGHLGSFDVRTADMIAQVDEKFGYPAHSDSADTHQMYMLCLAENPHVLFTLAGSCPSPT
jgi:hypothetical protein